MMRALGSGAASEQGGGDWQDFPKGCIKEIDTKLVQAEIADIFGAGRGRKPRLASTGRI